MLSQTAEYALRAMVYLASRYPGSCTSREIADVSHIPPGYLSKILHGLGRAKLVVSQRGKRGGFTLVRAPFEMTLFEIVQAVDPLERITECPRAVEEHCEQLCPLHSYLDSEIARVQASLTKKTLGHLMAGTPATYPQV